MVHNPSDPQVERAQEYVDSPYMTQRLVHRQLLSAQIAGNHGVYRTTIELSRKVKATCTCPSDYFPCKHVHALRLTYELVPESFFDVEAFLEQLATQPTRQLLRAIRDLVLAYPPALAFLGVAGFAVSDEHADDAE
jgi:uncharacterized Zn finger protein